MMPPRRKTWKKANPESSSPKKLAQTTLHSLFGSSPVLLSPATPAKSPSPSKTTKFPSRRRSDQDQDAGSDVGAIHFEKEVTDSSSDEQPRLSPMKKRRIRLSSFDSAQPSQVAKPEKAGSNDDEPSVRRRIKGKGKRLRVEDSDREESPKRRLVKGIRPPSQEDEDDILDEIDEKRKGCSTFFVH